MTIAVHEFSVNLADDPNSSEDGFRVAANPHAHILCVLSTNT